jgi:predicted restriction endonuclease
MKKNICDLCNKEITTDSHHIKSASKGGDNSLGNKCELCPNCHRLVHTGDIILEGKFLTTSCKNISEYELIFHARNDESVTGLKSPDVWIY